MSSVSNPELLCFSDDLHFGVGSALEIGDRIYDSWRNGLDVEVKEDDTLVSKVEIDTNQWFNEHSLAVYGTSVEVIGEEVPLAATTPPLPGEPRRSWTLDTGDGSGELAATHRNLRTGEPINPMRPIPPGAQPQLIQEQERTTCTGLGLIKNAQVWSGVAYNPFKNRLLVADRDLNGTFLIDPNSIQPDGAAYGQRVKVNEAPLFPGYVAWDHATWEGGAVDIGPLQQALRTPPLNHYSAIDQAAQVALGNSSCAVFAGDTLHDIVPSLALVHWAGGVAFEPGGRLVDPDKLTKPLSGIVYANRIGYLSLMQALQTGESSTLGGTLCVTNYEGTRFVMPLRAVRAGRPVMQLSEKLVNYAITDGGVDTNKVVIKSFGFQRNTSLSPREVRRLKRQTRRLGAGKWFYKNHVHANGTARVGIARIPNPEKLVTIKHKDDTEQTLSTGDLVLQSLRTAVSSKIKRQTEQHHHAAI